MENRHNIIKTNMANEVFKVLHNWIVTGKIKPGEKFPSQQELSKYFSVSRNTLREAVYKLNVMGFVTIKQGSGTFVNITGPTNYIAGLSEHLMTENINIRDFLEARIYLEKAIVGLVVKRRDEESLNKLREIVAKQENALKSKDIQGFGKLDIDFHCMLATVCKNSVLHKFIETIVSFLNIFITEVSLLPKATENAFYYHKRILKEIELRNVENAEKMVVNHLRNVIKTLDKHKKTNLSKDIIINK